MFFISSHMFIYFLMYLFLLFFMFMVDTFYLFWIFMELSTLVFMGVSYSCFKNNYTFLLSFFIIQTVSAFGIFIFYCLDFKMGFTIFYMLKMSLFPFHFWYFNLITNFPNIILYFSSTFFKVPSLLMFYLFFNMFNLYMLYISFIFTMIVGGLMMIWSNDLRFLLIGSSVVNNVWFIISIQSSMMTFFIYFLMYSFFLFVLFNLYKDLQSFKLNVENYTLYMSVISLAGLPPFPIFFIKIYMMFFLIKMMSFNMILLLILLLNLLSVLGYLKYLFNSFLMKYKLIIML